MFIFLPKTNVKVCKTSLEKSLQYIIYLLREMALRYFSEIFLVAWALDAQGKLGILERFEIVIFWWLKPE